MNERILTDEEIPISLLVNETVTADDIIDLCESQDTKTANHYETVIIPERERKLIEEIEASFRPGLDNLPGHIVSAKYWQQLKQERGK